MPMVRQSVARQLIARSPTNLAFVRIVAWGICCRSATLRRDGRKGRDISRIHDSRKTGPAHARLNRATIPFDLGPMLVPPGAPQQVSSALPDGVQPQSQRSVGVKKAQSNAGSALRQSTTNLKSP
jgi:hypothetical protein